MDIRYYLDPDTQLPHIYGHGISEAEVEQVFRNPGEEVRGVRGIRGSRMKSAQTDAGRHLQVIFMPDDDPRSVFVITAYELQGKAKQAYRRRRRRKGR